MENGVGAEKFVIRRIMSPVAACSQRSLLLPSCQTSSSFFSSLIESEAPAAELGDKSICNMKFKRVGDVLFFFKISPSCFWCFIYFKQSQIQLRFSDFGFLNPMKPILFVPPTWQADLHETQINYLHENAAHIYIYNLTRGWQLRTTWLHLHCHWTHEYRSLINYMQK